MNRHIVTSLGLGLGLALSLVGTGCSKSKAALDKCKKADSTSAEGLKVCQEAWKAHADSSEFGDLTQEFDKRLDAACKDSARIADCDTYCPLRITDPGPKYKTMTLSMCALRGYGSIDGQVTNTKPARYGPNSPEVLNPCMTECRAKSDNPSSPEYQSCLAMCKVRKAAELNQR